jgi:hypothetical protein
VDTSSTSKFSLNGGYTEATVAKESGTEEKSQAGRLDPAGFGRADQVGCFTNFPSYMGFHGISSSQLTKSIIFQDR